MAFFSWDDRPVIVRGIVLAAGESRRMGRPKAGLPVRPGGPTFAAAAVAALWRPHVHDVVVVAGAHAAAVREALSGAAPPPRVIEHDGWRDGQLSSLRAGLAALDPLPDAVIVTLVDCPFVQPATVDRLLEHWRASRAPIVRPAIGARHGHPVIFDRRTFDDLRTVPREIGAKAVIARWAHEVANVEVDDAGVLADVDTPEDYEAVLRRAPR